MGEFYFRKPITCLFICRYRRYAIFGMAFALRSRAAVTGYNDEITDSQEGLELVK